MSTIEERIKAQEEKLKQLKAQKAKVDARKKAVQAKAQRSQDTRRKVLAGALMLEMMEKDATTKQRFMQHLNSYLTRADDRSLFGLPEKAPTAPKAPAPGAGAEA